MKSKRAARNVDVSAAARREAVVRNWNALSVPGGGDASLSRLFLDIRNRFCLVLDVLIDAIELRDRLLAIPLDDGALCRVRARGEVRRQGVDAALQGVGERLRPIE